MFRTILTRQAPAGARFFSTTPAARKSVVDSAKDVLKKVDKTVANQAVKGIEKGEQVADAVKSSLPDSTQQAKGQASELAGKAKGTAYEASGNIKGKANELAGEAQGK
ncbi:hypothetical protein GQ43DRAFT_349577, partial [Delitschia confertaspora ATCC 74209]